MNFWIVLVIVVTVAIVLAVLLRREIDNAPTIEEEDGYAKPVK